MEGSKLVRLGAVTLDTTQGILWSSGGTIYLRRQSFDVLRYLSERPNRVVSKDELFQAVWPNVTVGDDSLAQCISEIRRALGADCREIVKTIPRRGYMVVKSGIASPSQLESSPSTARDFAPTQPSIAVLPFSSFGDGPQQEYFSDGITEDIITELSRFSELLVIARNSTFQYKGKSVDVRQIGRELGVQYVLEGSVRREKKKVRIAAQLVETSSGTHHWAERYDRNLKDALAVQDEVARAISSVLPLHVSKAESERILLKPPSSWLAYDHYLRSAACVATYHYSYAKQSLLDARSHLKEALAIDPCYARAHAALSHNYMSFWVHRWDDDFEWPNALELSYQAALQSVRLSPDLPEGHIALGQALTFMRQHDAALSAVERAISLNPNLTSFRFSYILVLAGEAARAAQLLETHMRLDPFYQPNAPSALGYALYFLKRYHDALPHLLEAASRAPNMSHCRYPLATTYAQLGRLDEAREQVAHALRLEPWYRISNSLTAKYFRRNEDAQHLLDGLRKAGFPE
jgi:adenylate cyclase